MIISIFKKNLFFNSLLLLPFAMILRLYSLIYSSKLHVVQDGGILYDLFLQILPSNPLFQSFLSVFIVFYEAVLINRLIIKNRFTRNNTLLPGMFFIVLVSLSPLMQNLSPVMLGLVFVILSLSNLFKTYKKYSSERFLFNTGFYLGIAILFYTNYILLILPFFLSLVSIKAFKLREILQMLSGLVLVVYFYLFGMYWIDKQPEFPSFDVYSLFGLNIDIYQYLIFSIYLFLIFNTIFSYRKFVIKKSIQSQKKINIYFGILLFSVFTIFFNNPDYIFNYLYLIAFPLSYFTSAIFLRIKNNLIIEIVTVIIIFAILIYQFQIY